MAFLLVEYTNLLQAFRSHGYSLGPVRSYFEGATGPFIFLRHDVDRMPGRALRMAGAEQAMGISSTYYFRCNRSGEFPGSYIKRIAGLKHEIGFHYETFSRAKGDVPESLERFSAELAALRTLVDVKTVAAHGSPLAEYSNVACSEDVDFEKLGLLGEPGVHFDFSEVLYVTDTGGVYGSHHNARDKVNGKQLCDATPPVELGRILKPQEESLILLNSHPERWPAGRLALLQAVVTDTVINVIKRIAGSRRA